LIHDATQASRREYAVDRRGKHPFFAFDILPSAKSIRANRETSTQSWAMVSEAGQMKRAEISRNHSFKLTDTPVAKEKSG